MLTSPCLREGRAPRRPPWHLLLLCRCPVVVWSGSLLDVKATSRPWPLSLCFPLCLSQYIKACKMGNMDQALSVWFLLGWIGGDSCNLIGSFLADQLPLQVGRPWTGRAPRTAMAEALGRPADGLGLQNPDLLFHLMRALCPDIQCDNELVTALPWASVSPSAKWSQQTRGYWGLVPLRRDDPD